MPRASGFATPDVPQERLIELTRHIRATTPPWTLEVDAEVADALAEAGAEVHLLVGTGHRPQDHATFNDVMRAFWSLSDGIDGDDAAGQGDEVPTAGL